MPGEWWFYPAVKFLHVLSMGVWIGASAAAPIGMRRSFALGGEHAREFVRRLRAATRLIVAAALLTVATGVLMVHLAGGWRNMPTRIYVGAALTALVFLLGGAVGQPTLAALARHFDGGGDAPSGDRLRRRFVLIIGTEMALRVAVLALMVLPL